METEKTNQNVFLSTVIKEMNNWKAPVVDHEVGNYIHLEPISLFFLFHQFSSYQNVLNT